MKAMWAGKITGAAAALIAACVLYQANAKADDWTPEQQVKLAAAETLLAVDWLQTRQIAKNPDTYHELNPILGNHPSVGRVNLYFLSSAVATYVLADVLPSKYRDWLLTGVIAVEVIATANNANIGVKVRW